VVNSSRASWWQAQFEMDLQARNDENRSRVEHVMAKKWSEIRKQHAPEVEARISQKVINRGKVIALIATETDPILRELAEIDPDVYLRRKEACGDLGLRRMQQ
jgi:hypothetical protein